MKQNELIPFCMCCAKRIIGVVLIIFGIVGLFLPLLQGIVMIVAGLALLGNHTLANYLSSLKDRLIAWWRKAR